MNLKIALIGYGKMGKQIEQIALQKGHSISLKFDFKSPLSKDIPLDQVDVFIDFSIPGAVLSNLKTVAHLQKPAVRKALTPCSPFKNFGAELALKKSFRENSWDRFRKKLEDSCKSSFGFVDLFYPKLSKK